VEVGVYYISKKSMEERVCEVRWPRFVPGAQTLALRMSISVPFPPSDEGLPAGMVLVLSPHRIHLGFVGRGVQDC